MKKIPTTCAICSINIEVRPSKYKPGNNYCSRPCFYKMLNRKKGQTKKCLICDKEFYTHPKRVGAKYCSQRCNAENKKRKAAIRIEQKKCKICEKLFQPRRSSSLYCSPECRIKASRKKDSNYHKVEITCLQCKGTFIKNKKNKFCSLDCANEWSKRNQVTVICESCGKKVSVSKSRSAKFLACSKSCLEKITESNLERLGYAILADLNIMFLPQHIINNKFCVDAFVPDWNLIIQFDGDYWHGKPDKYPLPNTMQRRSINRDRSHDAYMSTCGISVYRIWESDMDKFKDDMSKYLHDKKF